MDKKGLETYNDSIKILILLLCTSIRQHKDIEIRIIITCIYIHNNLYDQLN